MPLALFWDNWLGPLTLKETSLCKLTLQQHFQWAHLIEQMDQNGTLHSMYPFHKMLCRKYNHHHRVYHCPSSLLLVQTISCGGKKLLDGVATHHGVCFPHHSTPRLTNARATVLSRLALDYKWGRWKPRNNKFEQKSTNWRRRKQPQMHVLLTRWSSVKKPRRMIQCSWRKSETSKTCNII